MIAQFRERVESNVQAWRSLKMLYQNLCCYTLVVV